MIRSVCILCLVLLLCSAEIQAQPFGTDVFAACSGSKVIRISPTGGLNTVFTGRSNVNMLCMGNSNVHLVIGYSSSPPELLVVDPATGVVTSTLHSGSPIPYVDYLNPTDDGDFVVAANTDIYLVKGDGSGVTRVAGGSPFQNLQGIVRDIVTGGYGAGDITTDSIYEVAPDGTITNTYAEANMNAFSLTQDHRDGAFIAGGGASGRVYRIERNGTITTINPSAGTNCNAICFDRWSGTGEIVVGSNPLVRMDINGVIVKSHATLGTHYGMCFDQGRNIVIQKTASPNQYRFDIHVPSQPNMSYVLGLSASGFMPGIPLGSRVIPLIPDNVLLLSAQGLLFPYLQNNIGTLNSTGRPILSPTLDLSSFSNLTGLRVWAALVTLDGSAPNGVGVITKPVVLVLE